MRTHSKTLSISHTGIDGEHRSIGPFPGPGTGNLPSTTAVNKPVAQGANPASTSPSTFCGNLLTSGTGQSAPAANVVLGGAVAGTCFSGSISGGPGSSGGSSSLCNASIMTAAGIGSSGGVTGGSSASSIGGKSASIVDSVSGGLHDTGTSAQLPHMGASQAPGT
ncbi:unnamed protein product [Protopolystoma xenopodis]|uniref:Uncharacterized protein n=1 Tax=Protopolystoma xenopodis TaxID=117903 RepID=A0A3S5AHD9_9PLAT|nr:unnamed protein product [Protopolystoma xenopodis]